MESLYASRVAVVSVGRTSLAAHARFVVAMLAAESLDVPLCDVPLEGGVPSAPLTAIERGALFLELELGAPRIADNADADACLAARSTVRGVIGLCDGSVHADEELLGAIRSVRTTAQRIHRSHGPPGTLAPTIAIFVFCASEQQLERAASFGPDVRFITNVAKASDPSLALHLRVLVADFSAGIVRQLDAEASALQRLEETGQPPIDLGSGAASASALGDAPAVSATPVNVAPRAAPPAIGAGGLIDLGLSSGLGSIGLALGALRKRWAGRIAVRRAEVLLCLCAPLDALDALDRAGKALRTSAPDALFLGFAETLRAVALVQRARYYGGDGRTVTMPPPPPPFLHEAASALREAIAFFDAAAALPDVGGASDAVVQLALGARVLLARYLHTRPADRTLASLAAVAGCAEDDLLTLWASGSLPDTCLTEPSAAAAAAHMLETARFTAAALIPGDPSDAARSADGASGVAAFLAARMKKASAAAAGVAETVKTAVATAAAAATIPGADAGVPPTSSGTVGSRVTGTGRLPALAVLGPAATVLAASTGGGDRAAALAEAVDLMATVASRAREIRSAQFQARTLLQCAEFFEMAGLWRRSDACAARASRLLRALQAIPTRDDFVDAGAYEDLGHAKGGCVYEALLSGRGDEGSDKCATGAASSREPGGAPPLSTSEALLWPLPWARSHGPDAASGLPARPSALLSTASSFPCCRPAVAAALLLLSSEARDASLFSAMTAHNPACAANADVRATSGGPAAPESGPRVLLPPTAFADWAHALVADFWQCGELPLAAGIISLLSHLLQQGRRLRKALPPRQDDGALRLPPTTRVLRKLRVNTALSVSQAVAPPTSLTGASAQSERADQLVAALLRRRALLSTGAAAVALRSPRLTLRAILAGTTVSALQSPADALVLLKVLSAYVAEDATLALHAPVGSFAAERCPALAAWRPQPTRGILDALQGSLCLCRCDRSGCGGDFISADPPPPQLSLRAASPEPHGGDEPGTAEEVWTDPAMFGGCLATYLAHSAAPCLPGGLIAVEGAQQPQLLYTPAIPCFPLEVLALEWRLKSGPGREAPLILELQTSLAGSQGSAVMLQPAGPHGRTARAGRRVYDEIGSGAKEGAEPPPLARSRAEVPPLTSPTPLLPGAPLEDAAAHPVPLVLVVRLHNMSATEVSGAFAVTAMQAAVMRYSDILPVMLSWESVSVPPGATVSVECTLSVDRGALPLLIRAESLLLCCGGSVLHRLGVERPAAAAAAAEAWDVHLAAAAPPPSSAGAVSGPPPLRRPERGEHEASPLPVTPATQAAALGYAVFGSAWFESRPAVRA